MDSRKRELNPPIFIVGGPRTGTKMLRDTLGKHKSIKTTKYELDTIWYYGSKNVDHDELKPENITEEIKHHIRKEFEKIAGHREEVRVVDKTVSNSLRIDYIREVFPEAQFIHIIRDGRDAIASIRKRWESPIDPKYLWREKAFLLSPKKIPYFVAKQVSHYISKVFMKGNEVKSWGPRFEGIDEYRDKYELIELCAIQWKNCVEAVLQSAEDLNDATYLEVRYEDLVEEPYKKLRQIGDFLGIENIKPWINFAEEKYYNESISKWKNELSDEDMKLVLPHIEEYLRKFGYHGE